MPEQFIFLFDYLLQMGVAHLKIIVFLAVLLLLFASLELLQHALIKTFDLVELNFNIVELFVLKVANVLLSPKFLLEI
jgi:hypothetical protein